MWTVLTLILVGAVLLILETILPGMIAGVLGICCLIAAVVAGYTSYGVLGGNLILAGVVAGLLVGTLVWIKYFPESRLAKVFISRRVVGDLKVDKPELLDRIGVAQTNLRPSGIALINGQRVDVVTEGPMVERGASVRVVAVEGMRVVVREIESGKGSNKREPI
jgi:membrane-bound serine protease (ClpP class)